MWIELTKKYQDEYGENTILLMQVGAFFEVYGIYDKENDMIISSKITDFSQICELNVVDKNTCVGKNNVMMAGFKDFMIEKYLRKEIESEMRKALEKSMIETNLMDKWQKPVQKPEYKQNNQQ